MQAEPNMTEITQLMDNNQAATQWARNHGLINHRHNFVDPVTGVNTQRIESNWNAIKSKILSHTGGQTTSLHARLVEYAWRMEHRGHEFSALIAEINRQFPQV
jgi:hypothetical protein